MLVWQYINSKDYHVVQNGQEPAVAAAAGGEWWRIWETNAAAADVTNAASKGITCA